MIKKAISEAVAEATRLGKLRPNSVDSLTGQNSGNNLGAETPVMHFEQWERGRDRGQTDSQRRRLREQEYPILRCPANLDAPGARGPQPGRRAQVPPARRLAGAGAGVRARRAGRLHRQRPRATATSWPRNSSSARSTTSNPNPDAGQARRGNHGRGQHAGRRRDGIRRRSLR